MYDPVKEVTLIVGLPGAGKTRLSKKMMEDDPKSKALSLDNVDKSRPLYHYVSSNEHLIVEGAIEKNQIFKVLEWIKDGGASFKKLNIISFEEDIEACIWNDRARTRDKKSKTTISNMKIEVPTKEELKERWPKLKVSYKTLPVTRADPVKVWAIESAGVHEGSIYNKKPRSFWGNKNYNGPEKMYIYGSSWCLGGTYGNCWDNNLGTVYPSDPPEGFYELEEILKKVAPNITFLQFRELSDACISTETYSDGDYYGGSTQHAQKVCDLRALYNWLKSNGYIEEPK